MLSVKVAALLRRLKRNWYAKICARYFHTRFIASSECRRIVEIWRRAKMASSSHVTLIVSFPRILRDDIFIDHGLAPVEVCFSIAFDADFADVFEVRGLTRARRGTRSDRIIDSYQLCFAYQGLDGVLQR